MDAGKEAPVVRFGLDVGAVPAFVAPHAFGHGQVVDSTRHRASDFGTQRLQSVTFLRLCGLRIQQLDAPAVVEKTYAVTT